MASKTNTWPDSVLRMLRSRSEHTSRYEVGTFYADDSATTNSLSAFWAARKAGTVVPEEHVTFDGPWQVALFEAYEKFAEEVDTIASDEYSVSKDDGHNAKVGADVIWEQLDAMVGAQVDLEVDMGWQVYIQQENDQPQVCVYLVRVR